MLNRTGRAPGQRVQVGDTASLKVLGRAADWYAKEKPVCLECGQGLC